MVRASGMRKRSTLAIPTSLLDCLMWSYRNSVTSSADRVQCHVSVAVVEEPPNRGPVGFARTASRELGQGRQPPRQSMVRQYAAQLVANIVKRHGRTALCDNDSGADDLPPLGVGTAHHDGLGDRVELDLSLIHISEPTR